MTMEPCLDCYGTGVNPKYKTFSCGFCEGKKVVQAKVIVEAPIEDLNVIKITWLQLILFVIFVVSLGCSIAKLTQY